MARQKLFIGGLIGGIAGKLVGGLFGGDSGGRPGGGGTKALPYETLWLKNKDNQIGL